MEIKTTVLLEDGTAEFQGTLSDTELNIVMQVGLSTLLRQGSMPFLRLKDNTIVRDYANPITGH